MVQIVGWSLILNKNKRQEKEREREIKRDSVWMKRD